MASRVMTIPKLIFGITGGLYLGYGLSEIIDFNKGFMRLESYFEGRSLNSRINLTYLCLYDHPTFEAIVLEEHDACFDRFKRSKIGDYWYGTCVACSPYAMECFFLANRQMKRFAGHYVSWKDVEESSPYSNVEYHRGLFATTRPPGVYRPTHSQWSEEKLDYFIKQGEIDRKILKEQIDIVNNERANKVKLIPELKIYHPLLYLYILATYRD
jgi:hypothetical protein